VAQESPEPGLSVTMARKAALTWLTVHPHSTAEAGGNHHRLVCRACRRTEAVDCVVGERGCLEPPDAHGFVIDEAEVIFWGLCPACQAAGWRPE